jgi:diguanylate cyclase (GGDEF)-like protein
MERLDVSRKIPISIIIADIDGLKKVNDTYGHQKGDEYIKRAADIIADVTRKEDILARIGGDEFAALLPETSKMATKKIIERIKEKLTTNNHKNEIPLSISIGYSVKEDRNEELEEILKQADAMMYNKKRNKKHSSL